MKTNLKTLFAAVLITGFGINFTSCGSKENTADEQKTSKTETETEQPADTKGGNAYAGEGLVTNAAKCGQCHKTTDEKLIGPGLKGVTTRRSDDWIRSMIKDPAGWVQTDPDAKKLFEEYNNVPMTPIEVTDAEIEDILAYLHKNDK
ncbi:MAG: cytochrome c [Flavobacteriales bacterium]|nr:cytochrome c [Flavobacteriales bacterium]